MTNFELEEDSNVTSSSDGDGASATIKTAAKSKIKASKSSNPNSPSSSSSIEPGGEGLDPDTANEPVSSASLYPTISMGPPQSTSLSLISSSSVPGYGGYGGNSSYVNGNHGDLFGGGGGGASTSSWTSVSPSNGYLRPPGDMGLQNIGNTCFMNSGLQCLIHTPSLVEYFLRSTFELKLQEEEFNLTREFQSIIKLAWLGICISFNLNEFKNKLGDIHSQFKDGRQHDCQEFLALMLDTLHEQLKKIEEDTMNQNSIVSSLPIRPFVRLNGIVNKSEPLVVSALKNETSSTSRSGGLGLLRPFKVQNPNSSTVRPIHTNWTEKIESLQIPSAQKKPRINSPEKHKCLVNRVRLGERVTSIKPSGYSSKFFSYENKLSSGASDADKVQPVLPSIAANGVSKLWENSKNASGNQKSKSVRRKKVEAKGRPKSNTRSDKPGPAKKLRMWNGEEDSEQSLHESLLYRDEADGNEGTTLPSPSSIITTISEVDSGIGIGDGYHIQPKEENETSSFVSSPPQSLSGHSTSSSPQEQDHHDEDTGLNFSGGLTEARRAEEYWEKHCADNNTVICKSFQGLFKSTVICSECKFVSVTYEPFMYLSVPIPRITTRSIDVRFISIKGERRVESVTVILQNYDTVLKLKESVCDVIPGLEFNVLNSGDLIVVEVVNYNIVRKLDDDTLIIYVNDQTRNIYMYELNDNFNEKYGQETNSLSLHGMSMCQSEETNNNNYISYNPSESKSSELYPQTYLDEDWDNDLPPVPLIEMGECGSEGESVNLLLDQGDNVNEDLLQLGSTIGNSSCSQNTIKEDKSDGLNGIDEMEIVSSTQQDVQHDQTTDCILSTSQYPQCLICLEQYSTAYLRKHKDCDAVICEECMKDAARYFQEDKVKNTVNASNLSHLECPTCFQKVDRLKDFKIFWSLPTCQLMGIGILFRRQSDSNNNSTLSPTNLFGAPLLVRIPSCIPAQELQHFLQQLNPFPQLECRIVNMNSDGTRCALCLMSDHCDGCEIPSFGEVSLQPNTTLVFSYSDISIEQVSDFSPTDMATATTASAFFANTSSCIPQEPPVDIHDCLRSFSEVEYLDEQNPWNCPSCKKRQCATKTMTICRLPDYLIIYLKRFVYENSESKKLNNRLNFPLSGLDMRSYLDQECLPQSQQGEVQEYDLYSCVCHYGTPTSGHYTAFSKNPVTQSWHYFNDSTVEEKMPQDSYDFSSAYILFFKRQGLPIKIPGRTSTNIVRPVSSVPPLLTTTGPHRPIGVAYANPIRKKCNWDKEHNSLLPDSSSSTSMDDIKLSASATGVSPMKRIYGSGASTSTSTSQFDFKDEDEADNDSKMENDENAVPPRTQHRTTASSVIDSHNGYMELD